MADTSDIYVSNMEAAPGRAVVRELGVVQGSTVQARNIGRDILAGLKNILGGELRSYTELLEKARAEALDRMLDEARKKGANGVLNVRFTTATIAEGAAEILVYGTAVELD